MISIKEYKIVSSLQEAYDLNQSKTNTIIGGMCWLKMQSKNVKIAIDMSNLGLDSITEKEDCFIIGAMTTLRTVETDKALSAFFKDEIKQSLSHIVGVQFRNCATIGGSIFMRLGFSDVLTSLLALDAKVELFEQGIISLEEFTKIPHNNDILVNVILPKKALTMKYDSFRNTFTDIPVITVAVTKDSAGIRAIVGARPKSAVKVWDEKGLLSEELTAQNILEFSNFVAENLDFSTNNRASAGYRKHLCKVLVKRCITAIVEEGK